MLKYFKVLIHNLFKKEVPESLFLQILNEFKELKEKAIK